MATEYYKRFRPKTLKGLVGQDIAVAKLESFFQRKAVPHFLLLTGPSGCGKTTVARIVKEMLGCGDSDFQEVNAADARGVDEVRTIRRSMNLAPIEGSCRIWLVDEAHKLTNDAQNAFLKILEDTPEHVYFILATTEPAKLIATIKTRGTEVKLMGLDETALNRVLRRVIDKEGLSVSDEVIDEIIEASEGSGRKALVILESIGSLAGDDKQVEAIRNSTFDKDLAFKLAANLVKNFKVQWSDVAPLLRQIKEKEEDVEGVRYVVLGYARSCMVGKEGKAVNQALGDRAFRVIEVFDRNFYDSKQAGLAAACWAIVHKK